MLILVLRKKKKKSAVVPRTDPSLCSEAIWWSLDPVLVHEEPSPQLFHFTSVRLAPNPPLTRPSSHLVLPLLGPSFSAVLPVLHPVHSFQKQVNQCSPFQRNWLWPLFNKTTLPKLWQMLKFICNSALQKRAWCSFCRHSFYCFSGIEMGTSAEICLCYYMYFTQKKKMKLKKDHHTYICRAIRNWIYGTVIPRREEAEWEGTHQARGAHHNSCYVFPLARAQSPCENFSLVLRTEYLRRILVPPVL